MNQALSASKSSEKATYASWSQYFDTEKRKDCGLDIEALLAYWISWFLLPSELEDGLKNSVFPLAILLGKGKRSTLAPLYFGSLFRPS